MAGVTRRLRLRYPTGGDPAAVPDDMQLLAEQLDDQLLGYDQGPLTSRPAAAVEGRMYYAVDVGSLYYDTGSGWIVSGYQPGDVRWTGRFSIEPGWLQCDGGAVSRTTYAALFAAVGTKFGSGDGVASFNLPDLRGRVPIGTGGGPGLSFRGIGDRGGTEAHVLTIAEMPRHSHVNTTGVTPGAFIQAGTGYGEGGDGDSTASAGGGVAHNNLQPYLALSAWIKL